MKNTIAMAPDKQQRIPQPEAESPESEGNFLAFDILVWRLAVQHQVISPGDFS